MGLIAGIYSKALGANIHDNVTGMLRSQAHRDDSRPVLHDGDGCAFGMANRQNTVFCDPQNIAEPNIAENKNNDIHAFVDGVVLDVLRHKDNLERMGYRIPVPTCSAVIEAAYRKCGLDFMNHLEGEFACAIWDNKEKRLILARDPYGHKPLHYYSNYDKFIFSSEIKGILAAGVSGEINLIGLSDFLSLNCIPCPATIFKEIFQVVPGTMLIVDNNGIRTKTYWDSKLSTDESISFDEAVQQTSDRIHDAVRKRMISDDVYCFLSGGIDSSAIVSFAAEISSKPIHAISVGFKEEEKNELEDAAIMAKHVGAEHHQVIASPDSFFDMLETIVCQQDSPFTDTSSYPTFYAAKLARKFTDLILTGDGPDQTMGGSGHHVFAVRNNLFADRSNFMRFMSKIGSGLFGLLSNDPTPSIFSKIERKLYRDALSPVHAAYDLRSCFPDITKQFLCSRMLWDIHLNNNPYRHPESWFKEVEGIDNINRYLYADIKFYVPDDLMIKVDRMCMAHGLETLSPFQDIKLAEIVNKLPGNYKINQSSHGEISTKHILKEICESRFPQHTLRKKKQGFGIPIEKWLKQNNGSYIKEILLDENTLQRGYFKRKSIEKIVNVFLNNKGDYYFPSSYGMVALLTLELWHRRYIDK